MLQFPLAPELKRSGASKKGQSEIKCRQFLQYAKDNGEGHFDSYALREYQPGTMTETTGKTRSSRMFWIYLECSGFIFFLFNKKGRVISDSAMVFRIS